MQILHISRICIKSCLFNLQETTFSFICTETKAVIQNLKDGNTTDHKNKLDGNPGNQRSNVWLQLSK